MSPRWIEPSWKSTGNWTRKLEAATTTTMAAMATQKRASIRMHLYEPLTGSRPGRDVPRLAQNKTARSLTPRGQFVTGTGRSGSQSCANFLLDALSQRRQRVVVLLEQEGIQPAAVFNRTQGVRTDAQLDGAVQRFRHQRHFHQVRKEPATSAIESVRNVVANHNALASKFTAPCHGHVSCCKRPLMRGSSPATGLAVLKSEGSLENMGGPVKTNASSIQRERLAPDHCRRHFQTLVRFAPPIAETPDLDPAPFRRLCRTRPVRQPARQRGPGRGPSQLYPDPGRHQYCQHGCRSQG